MLWNLEGGLCWVLTRLDKILMGAIALVALLGLFLFRPQAEALGDRVVVEAQGKVVKVIPMDQLEPGRQLSITGPLGNSILEMGQDKVRLVDSPCPDHICMQMGWISRPGEMIVCLPNQIIVRIEGPQGRELDGIAQ